MNILRDAGNNQPSGPPPGLAMAYEVLTPDEERALIALVEASGIEAFAYDPGAIIQWHLDKPAWNHVVGISLGAATRWSITFRSLSDAGRRLADRATRRV
jgi:alkylated DNA repair dioxygenase AlkB